MMDSKKKGWPREGGKSADDIAEARTKKITGDKPGRRHKADEEESLEVGRRRISQEGTKRVEKKEVAEKQLTGDPLQGGSKSV